MSACAGCSGLAHLTDALAQDLAADELAAKENAEAFFICDTPQITTIDLNVYAAPASDGGAIGINPSPPAETIRLDPYTTAQQQLRWRPQDVQAVTSDGRPIVRIGFADGSDWQQAQVRTLSEQWRSHTIGVDFEFVDRNKKAEITISFAGGTNWSKTGRESRSVSYGGTPTMFLPHVRQDQPAATWRRVVLHEFGHGVMTFGHEHRHADAGLKFKSASYIRDAINAMLGGNSWTIDKVQTNITNPPYSSSRTCTAYDTRSIMHYPIQADWLIAGTPVPYPETTLSERDVQCAMKVYGSA